PPPMPVRSSSGRNICGGRLSTTYQPRSSSALATVDRPAPDMPVTMRNSFFSSSVIGTSSPCVPSLSSLQVSMDVQCECGSDALNFLNLCSIGSAQCSDRAKVLQKRFDPR